MDVNTSEVSFRHKVFPEMPYIYPPQTIGLHLAGPVPTVVSLVRPGVGSNVIGLLASGLSRFANQLIVCSSLIFAIRWVDWPPNSGICCLMFYTVSMKIICLLMCLIPVQGFASDLTDMQIGKEVAWQALNIIDFGQTRNIANRCHVTDYYEHNPILGDCPNIQSVNKYFISSAIIHYAITKYLTTHRDAWQNTTIIVSIGFIQHNYSLGLKIDF